MPDIDKAAFAALTERARAGDSDAIDELLCLRAGCANGCARKLLPRAIRPLFDSMDFVQAVWTSLVADKKCFSNFEDPQRLLASPTGAVQHKVHKEYTRRTRTQKYNVRCEERLFVLRNGQDVTREPAGPTRRQVNRLRLTNY